MKKTADNSEFRMRKPELHEFDAAGLCDGYRHRRFSPIEVCEHLLSRIEDPRLNCNAFAEVDAAGALALAHASAQRWQAGQVLGELDGIPVAIKDVVDVVGLATRYGSPALVDAPPAVEDCLLVRRLRAAGAIILGKTRTWEFAWRAEIGRDPVEVVENPRLPGYSPGGSSSGSAAAVAAGLCPLAFGTDSGGSVRGPAAFCGIFGLKPSHARIPVYPPSPMGELEHNGIFARSVNDIGTALRAVEGFDPSDPASWPFVAALDDPRPRLEDLRFAISLGFGLVLNFS